MITICENNPNQLPILSLLQDDKLMTHINH